MSSEGNLLIENLIYVIDVENRAAEGIRIYLSFAEKSFKELFRVHSRNLNHRKCLKVYGKMKIKFWSNILSFLKGTYYRTF